MSNVTETLVQLWENQDSDLLSDSLALHFKNHDRRFWRDVAAEGLRIYNMMFAENAEQHSALDSFIASVAAAAADGVFSAIAAAIGVKSADVECAVSRWYDDQDTAIPSIGLERLQQMLPQQGDPSWERVVLGRLYHERVLHRFHDAAFTAAETLSLNIDEPDIDGPDIDGLDPSDITRGDSGWTWRQIVAPSEDSESETAIDTVGAAIVKAGYRVTGHGFDATYEWLNFDIAMPAHDPLDLYEMDSCATPAE